MINFRNLFLIICTAFFLLQCNDRNNQGDGYTTLFNGESFDGWYLKIRSGDSIEAAKVFQVSEGLVHVFKDHPDSFNLNQGGQTHGLMYTNGTYDKFSFKFDYKWGKKIMNNFGRFQYDAGMYYHVYDDKIWPNGLEYQVRYNHLEDKNHTGDYWSSGVTFQWFSEDSTTFKASWEGGKPMPIRGGEHLASLDAEFNALNDEWNTCEIIAMGDKYAIHKLNGKVVNYATDLNRSGGVIGLQSETAEIFYRNIKIKEFDKFIPAEEFLE